MPGPKGPPPTPDAQGVWHYPVPEVPKAPPQPKKAPPPYIPEEVVPAKRAPPPLPLELVPPAKRSATPMDVDSDIPRKSAPAKPKAPTIQEHDAKALSMATPMVVDSSLARLEADHDVILPFRATI